MHAVFQILLSGNDCHEVEGFILQNGFPCAANAPMASSGSVDANPLCCLGHTCGIADQAINGLGGPSLAVTDECQMPDAHQD